jgi:uncharacterized protein (DUF1697 family)
VDDLNLPAQVGQLPAGTSALAAFRAVRSLVQQWNDARVRTHVALLRGINVLGRNKVAMADLRGVVAALGHREVMTYIQSGNVVFAAGRADDDCALAEELEAAVAARLGVRPAVVVLARAQLLNVVSTNPFRQVVDPRTLHGVFFREAPSSDGIDAVAAAVGRARVKGSRDDARVIGRTLYLWTPEGFAPSVLRRELDRGGNLRAPMHSGTARNWATVTTLVSLLEGEEEGG